MLASAALFGAAVVFGWGYGSEPIIKDGVEQSIFYKYFKHVKSGTGSVFLDFFQYMRGIFSNRLAGLGLTIMAVGGFGMYLSQIKASNKLVEYAIKPFSNLKEPYFLMCLFYLLGVFLTMFITSATGLGLLLMVTVYPILLRIGISKLSAVGMIVTTGCLELGPIQTNLIVAANYSNIEPSEYFVYFELPVALITAFVMCAAHYFWQKRNDRLMGHDVQHAKANNEFSKIGDKELADIPWFYALLPLVPFVFVMLFSKIAITVFKIDLGIKMGIVPALFVSVAFIMFVDFIKNKGNIKATMQNFDAFLKGMQSLIPVVTLIIAGTMFSDGLKAIGAIDMMINAAENSGVGAIGMTLVMSFIIIGMGALMGSGNASFIPLASIAPPVAERFGVMAVTMLLPMQIAGSLARLFSPIAAVTVACAGMAGLNTVDVVKRTWVPIALGLITMLVSSILLHSVMQINADAGWYLIKE